MAGEEVLIPQLGNNQLHFHFLHRLTALMRLMLSAAQQRGSPAKLPMTPQVDTTPWPLRGRRAQVGEAGALTHPNTQPAPRSSHYLSAAFVGQAGREGDAALS